MRSRRDPRNGELLSQVVRVGIALLALTALVVGGTGTAAADHGNNHCENHGDGGVVDSLLDTFRQNMCEYGSTITVAEFAFGAAGSGCAQDCFERDY